MVLAFLWLHQEGNYFHKQENNMEKCIHNALRYLEDSFHGDSVDDKYCANRLSLASGKESILSCCREGFPHCIPNLKPSFCGTDLVSPNWVLEMVQSQQILPNSQYGVSTY